mmetsp:Transcript_14533/g.34311  ORF Transcript_14533/g.34311 Transcript_14533/m.34311 type:complete len:204 (-) Transcript_14533:417-1028(-)
MQAASETDGVGFGTHLQVPKGMIIVGGNGDVHVFDGIAEAGVHVLRLHLQLQDAAVNLVDEQDGTHTLGESLSQHSLSLHCAAFNAINHNKRAISDTQRCGDFRGEVDVSWRVDEVHQERLRSAAILFVEVEVQRHTGALDRHAAGLLITARLHVADIAGTVGINEASLAHERVSECGLAVIDMSNDGQVPNVITDKLAWGDF